MKDTLYLYSQTSLFEIIKEMLFNYNIQPFVIDDFNNSNFKNNNVLLLLKDNIASEINKSFFSSNNVVVFLSSKNELANAIKLDNSKFIHAHSGVKKFLDEINTSFYSKTVILKNIEILGEKITNTKSGKSLTLTELEKKFLIVLFKNKQVKRDYLLEVILKIKKNIETKTIESHLTRIRRKLLKIESEIHIKSKEDTFYIYI